MVKFERKHRGAMPVFSCKGFSEKGTPQNVYSKQNKTVTYNINKERKNGKTAGIQC